MYRWLKRFIGFSVIVFLIALVGWGTLDLYERMYKGDPHYVVMPEGAAGIKPGSSVYYEGMIVGEVAETEALAHSDSETRLRANSAYLRKYDLLQEVEGLTPKKRNPYRKALVQFLLRQPSIPIGSATYSTGSAFYVTGQGYITLKNRGLTARASPEPVFIPSNVKHPWVEQYVNMALSVAPFMENVSSFHTRLQNWYHAPQSRNQQSDGTSGRSKLEAVPESIDKLQSTSEALNDGMNTLDTTIGSWNRNMESILRGIPDGDLSDPDDSGSGSGRTADLFRETGKLFGPSSRTTVRSLQHSINGWNRSLESVNEALENVDSDPFQNGLFE